MNLPTIKLSEDWEKFFRDKGQFIQPLDQIHEPEQLEVFKIWGQGLWNAIEGGKDELCKSINFALDESETDEEAIETVRKLCE